MNTSNTPLPPVPSAEELDRYLTGTSESSEYGRVSVWIAQFADIEEGIAMLRTMNRYPAKSVDVNRHFGALTNRIYGSSSKNRDFSTSVAFKDMGAGVSVDQSHRTNWRTKAWWRGALVPVCIVALLIAGWVISDYRSNISFSKQPFIYTTANGERGRITLPDGSHVTLSVASHIEIPSDFAVGNRIVSLHGEAIFNVTHNIGNPFVVKTASSSTRVLGTRFAIREYNTDSTAIVAVEDGKVAVGDVVVSANQEVVVHNGEAGTVRSIESHRFDFENGVLVLEGVSLQDAIPDLNRWFNAKVQLGDSTLATRILSGDCNAGSVVNLAELLELTFDIKVVRRGNILTLYSKDS